MPTEDKIEELAEEPQDVQSDGVRARQRPLSDVIEADKYVESKKIAKKKGFPLRMFVVDPPGSV